jgi:hypothetical protein
MFWFHRRFLNLRVWTCLFESTSLNPLVSVDLYLDVTIVPQGEEFPERNGVAGNRNTQPAGQDLQLRRQPRNQGDAEASPFGWLINYF